MHARVDRRPKLLMTTSTLPRWRGDTEPRFILDLALAMRLNFEITILAPMSPGASRCEDFDGVRIIRYRYAPLARLETLAAPGAIMPNIRRSPWKALLVPFLLFGLLRAMIGLLRTEEFDLAHCHWLIPQGAAYALISTFMRCPPALVTCHGGDAFTLNAPPLRLLKRWTLGRMRGVTAVSREIVTYLLLIGGPRLAASHHIPMGVDLLQFAANGRQAFRNAAAPPTILFVGRIAEKKGLPVLIAAMRGPALSMRRASLRVIGDGPDRARIVADARDLIAEGRLTFAGALSHEELSAQFGRADIFCAPFVIAADGDREGMPTVLLEAAASGVPIVAADVGGCRDLIVNGETGWLVRPGDIEALSAALCEALDSPLEARRRAAAAGRKVEAFSWPLIAARHASALRSILEPREMSQSAPSTIRYSVP